MTNYALSKIRTTKPINGIRLISASFKARLPKLIVILISLTIATLTGIIIPLIAKHAIDENIRNQDVTGLVQSVLLIICMIIISVITRFIQINLTGILGQEILLDIRQQIFDKIQQLPVRFVKENQSGDIIARLTSDVDAVNNFLSEGFVRLLSSIFTLVGISLIMAYISLPLSLLAIASCVVMFIFLLVQGNLLSSLLKKALDNDARLGSQMQEILNGFQVMKSFGQELVLNNEYQQLNNRYFSSAIKASLVNAISDPVLTLVIGITTLMSLVIGLSMLSSGAMTPGGVISYIIYIGLFYQPLQNISSLWKNIQAGIASAQRISEIISLQTNIKEAAVPFDKSDADMKGEIEFQNVDFSYDGKVPVLEHINFKAHAGSTIAIVGSTGAGKTTFINLIARLYDVDSGAILVDGVNVKEWKLDTLRSQIGYLLQDTFLFEGTIFNNLRYANPHLKREAMLQMFSTIGAEHYLLSLPKGLDTEVEIAGQNMSVGQRQLIAIARLLLRKPKILILDEATASIDTRTEQIIQNAIEVAAKGATSFIVAHRLSTIRNADIILVIEHNTISESGTHAELISKRGKYYEMYEKFVSA